jgi:SAM-dependent methyltransferase
MATFGQKYVELYEIFYQDKDYTGEAALIKNIIEKYKSNAKKILDYGCGTGRHAEKLLSLGFKVSGIDKNRYMLRKAREKFKDDKRISFYPVDKRNLIKPRSFDVCISLFDVLSYMNTNEEIVNFLNYVKRTLSANGLFIFDFWYGPGVLSLGPSKRNKEYTLNDRRVVRITTPEVDYYNSIVKVTHEVSIFKKRKKISTFIDTHHMRYFFKNEINLFLRVVGFEIIKFGTWQNLNSAPSLNDWSALVVARSIN